LYILYFRKGKNTKHKEKKMEPKTAKQIETEKRNALDHATKSWAIISCKWWRMRNEYRYNNGSREEYEKVNEQYKAARKTALIAGKEYGVAFHNAH